MFTITKEIGLDAGHRVPTHGSKCRHVHGHRYVVRATCEAAGLITAGEQSGMVLDFGFLKEEMMLRIHDPCDHGYIAWIEDEYFWKHMLLEASGKATNVIRQVVAWQGYAQINTWPATKFYVTPFIPTAENLAEHWFKRLHPWVYERSGGHATLVELTVYETPTSVASFRPDTNPEEAQ